MAASVALPASAHNAGRHDPHSKKVMTPNAPLGSQDINRGAITQNREASALLPQKYTYHHSHHPLNHKQEVEDEHLDSTTQLPQSSFSSTTSSNGRPKSMQRRISVGLPTHLRLHGKGYGVPASRKQNFAPASEPTTK